MEQLHIGEMIRRQLKAQRHSVVWFSRQLSCDRTNAYRIFSKRGIDTMLLHRICHILQYNFFEDIAHIVAGELHNKE